MKIALKIESSNYYFTGTRSAASLKLIAMKKAYAEIILNISKEAAMRVMTSERRAARYQHEMKVGKGEALQMLMRLKKMMDFKISQSEIASQNQQKKIEELEAQLEEAEDIVKDLREELEQTQTELERLKKEQKHLQHSNEPTNAFLREMEFGIYSYQSCENFLHPNSQENFSDFKIPNPSGRSECCKCGREIICTCGSYIRNRDLPSLTLRSREHGLYKTNGCTQKIRAYERNLLDKTMCLSWKTDKVNDENNIREQRQREKEKDKHISKAPASGAKSLSEMEQKLLLLQSFPGRRKRATRNRKKVTLLSGKHVPVLVKDSAYLSESLSVTAPMLPQVETETRTRRGYETSSGEETNLVEVSGEILPQNDDGFKEEKVPFEIDENGFAESLSSPDCKTDVKEVVLEANPTRQSIGERVVKYTFQRKRKRESMSGSILNAALETENKSDNKQNGDRNMGQPKSSLLKESPRDSRGLAQVARQLISLSEKRWWK